MKKILLLLLCLPFIVSAQNFDIDLLRDINLGRNRKLDGTFMFITNSVTPVSIAAPVIIYGWGWMKTEPTLKSKGIMIGASLTLCTVVATALKFSVNRPRPWVTYPDIEHMQEVGPYSFPSGHTSTAFVTATSLSIAFPKWYVIVPSYMWAGSVGYSRMHLGMHYPSDVLAGAIIGTGSAILCYKAQQWLNKRSSR